MAKSKKTPPPEPNPDSPFGNGPKKRIVKLSPQWHRLYYEPVASLTVAEVRLAVGCLGNEIRALRDEGLLQYDEEEVADYITAEPDGETPDADAANFQPPSEWKPAMRIPDFALSLLESSLQQVRQIAAAYGEDSARLKDIHKLAMDRAPELDSAVGEAVSVINALSNKTEWLIQGLSRGIVTDEEKAETCYSELPSTRSQPAEGKSRRSRRLTAPPLKEVAWRDAT
jgi:hypothetical protein